MISDRPPRRERPHRPARRRSCSPWCRRGLVRRHERQLRDLRGLSRDALVERLAYYLVEVNALHPFREGNGRAQRAFFAQLARSTGFTLAWQHLDAARNVEASAAIMRGDPEPMRKMLDTLVRGGT
jgi:fido (protein-threonine AMPylation protein)